MKTHRVVIVGAGIGGLAASLDLARQGVDVTVLERAATPGGKMREVAVGSTHVDAGPTVFTMRWVFDSLFADAGIALDNHLTLHPAHILARHAWSESEQLDLFADPARNEDAIGTLAGAAEARGYRAFRDDARRIYETLERTFIAAPRPSAPSLVRSIASQGLGGLWNIRPFETMWAALGRHFRDPRLRQLFGRYATYCGSSPYLAPATLMLVAHVEQQGVWLVEGGMHHVAQSLAEIAAAKGASFRYGATVAEICVDAGRTTAVRLTSGERIDADAVVVNADAAALSAGLFGRAVAQAVPPPAGQRSLSAMTWAMVAEADGFALARHSVFFSAITRRNSTPSPAAICRPNPPSISAPRTGPTQEPRPAALNASCASSTPPPQATPTRFPSRRSPHARIASSPNCGGMVCIFDRRRRRRRPHPSSTGSSRRRAGRCMAGRHTARWHPSRARDPRPRFPASIWRGAVCIRGRECRWQRCRAGWQRRGCWRTSLRRARPAWWLCVVVCRCAERRWRTRYHTHRLHR